MTPAQPSVVLVEGTWGGEWAERGSDFRVMLARRGVRVSKEFVWSEDLNGLPWWLSFTSGQRHSDWRAGGYAFGLYQGRRRAADVIAHSHGGAVVAYACAKYGARVRRLVTVGTPPRADLDPVWEMALPNIGYWLHVYDGRCAPWTDWWRRLGQFGDWRLGWRAPQALADRNLALDGVGHSGLFNDPQRFGEWDRILEVLRTTPKGARDVD